jgi:hypothetical protein
MNFKRKVHFTGTKFWDMFFDYQKSVICFKTLSDYKPRIKAKRLRSDMAYVWLFNYQMNKQSVSVYDVERNFSFFSK